MSHGIQSTDQLILVGQPAWHGLGVVVQEAPTVRQAFEQALPWEVQTVPALWRRPRPYTGWARSHVIEDAPGQVVLTTDHATGSSEAIAVVGPDFRPIHNRDLALLAETCEDVSGGHVETIGSLRGRRSVFCLLRVGEYGVGLNGDDVTNTYLCLTLAHDGTRALRGFGTTVRVVCANTEAAALGAADAQRAGFAIRHSGDVRARIEDARAAIQAGNLSLARHTEEDRALAGHPMTVAAVGDYFGRVSSILFPAVATERPADPKEAAAWERQRARARETVSAWVEELEHERQRLVSGTAYAALEAVTYWADHQRPRVRQVAADRLLGRGARIKAAAREAALAAVGVAR